MRDRRPAEPNVLSESDATRLLQRASELDAASSAHLQLAELRAAATQAGISANAFDAALEELQAAKSRVVAESEPTPRPRRRWTVLVAIAAVLGAFGVFGSMRVVPAAQASAIEEVFLLRCLSPGEARALISPILARSGAAYAPANARRVLVVRASQPQIDKVRSILEKEEAPGSTACAVRPAPETTR